MINKKYLIIVIVVILLVTGAVVYIAVQQLPVNLNNEVQDQKIGGGVNDEAVNVKKDILAPAEISPVLISKNKKKPTHTIEEAVKIAENSFCSTVGKLLTNEYWYDGDSKKWWIKMSTQQSGCNPSCVVLDELHEGVEINWMCTDVGETQRQSDCPVYRPTNPTFCNGTYEPPVKDANGCYGRPQKCVHVDY